MQYRINFVVLAIVALLMGTVGIAQAEIFAPSWADADSTYNGHQATCLGVDLDPSQVELENTTDPDVMNWTHSVSSSAWGQFQANNSTSPTIWVCLPDPVDISRIILWNGFQDNAAGDCRDRGVQNFSLYTSTGRGSSFTLQHTGALIHGTVGENVIAEAVNFATPVTGHYIRINVQDTYGGAYTVLGEVRFDAVKLASNIATPDSATASSRLYGGRRASAFPKRLFDGGYMNEPSVDLSEWTLEATSNALSNNSHHEATASAWVSTSGTVADEWVLLDLGSAQNLSKIHLWNLNVEGNTDLGAKGLVVEKSNAAGDDLGVLAVITDLAQATGTSAYAGQAFDLTGAVGVQYVKLHGFTNWGGGDQVGLSELRFEQSEVPEPGTLALLATGLIGLLCYAWRKRK